MENCKANRKNNDGVEQGAWEKEMDRRTETMNHSNEEIFQYAVSVTEPLFTLIPQALPTEVKEQIWCKK